MSGHLTEAAGLVTGLAALISTGMVYLAGRRADQLKAAQQQYDQRQGTEASLREDIAELDEQRRSCHDRNVQLWRRNEELRAWAYHLVALLDQHGVAPIPPEPHE